MADGSKPSVHEAFSAVMGEIRSVGKNERNAAQGFNFRGIDAVMNAAGPALRKHGVFTIPKLLSRETSTVEVGQKRTPMAHVVVEVEFTVYGPAGDTIVGSAPGEAMDAGDKGTSKAMSVAYRTFLLQALTLPTSDIDPDAEVYERSVREAPPVDPAKLTRSKGPQGDDPWAKSEMLVAKKRAVWDAAIAAGVIDSQDTDARATLAKEYAAQQGGDLASATVEELDQYLTTLKAAVGAS